MTITQETIGIIRKYEFAFQKKFGQNFLIDEHVLNKIVNAAEICSDDVVLEIGPGIGTITKAVAKKAGKVIAVEIDNNLIPILNDVLKDYDNIEVINADVLKLDIGKLGINKVVANLPYYITTPIIMGIFEAGVPIDSITVMVQKEVADRMKAGPSTKDYGALSLAVQYYADPYLVANVPQNCFMPRPNVGSAVIRLKRHEHPRITVKDETKLFRLISAAFGQRRKTLQNCLGNSSEIDCSKEDVANALKSLGLNESIRGEALTLEQFAALSDML